MNIYSSSLWRQDIDRVLEVIPDLSVLTGRSVLITGSTGLICSAVVDILIRYNELHEQKIEIIAAGRNREKAQKRFGEFFGREYFRFMYFDASKNDNDLAGRCDYVIYGAGNAYPGIIIKEPVETMLGNFNGLLQLLQFAEKGRSERLLYVSSSEVYGNKTNPHPFTETEYGMIDLLNPRNSYSVGKRAAETLCVSYAEEYGVDSVIVRPGHIYGPTASESDNRVSSAFAYKAACGEDLVMNSAGNQLRSYCYCLDCASAILTVLLRGEKNSAYNISNPSSIITIRQMAEILADNAGVKLIRRDATQQEAKAFNPMMNSSLNSEKLESLGWQGCFNAEEGLSHTVRILKEASR